MKSLIENYINGNLTEAKRQAKRHGHKAIREALKDMGYGVLSQVAIADYLKGLGSFQEACDAEQLDRESFARIAKQEGR